MNGPVLVLASNSPRRRELLALGGWLFHAQPADVDESLRPGETPAAYVLRLAESKARACATAAPFVPPRPDRHRSCREHAGARRQDRRTATARRFETAGTGTGSESARAEQVILAADTAVVSGHAILGKPKDQAEAVAMLRSLRGHSHQVLTGLAMLRMNDRTLVTDLCVTDVPMRGYRDDEIDEYVGSGDPFDKAGGYAIQHPGFHPVEGLHGCYASVMGLPLCHLTRSLHKFGLNPNVDVAEQCQNALGYACSISSAVLRGEMVG